MKRLIALAALLTAFGGGTALAQDGEFWTEDDVGLWESDNWGSDEYGSYDEDFNWDTADSEWTDWYGDADQNWNNYDDIGDEGWFDI